MQNIPFKQVGDIRRKENKLRKTRTSQCEYSKGI